MSDLVEIDGIVYVSFVLGEEPLIYRDVITLPKNVYKTLSSADIEAEKTSRYESWLLMANPPEDNTNG